MLCCAPSPPVGTVRSIAVTLIPAQFVASPAAPTALQYELAKRMV